MRIRSIMNNYYFFNPYDIQIKGKITDYDAQIEKLKKELDTTDAVMIGAGAGLSTAAGLTYSGERFDKYFFDFRDKYGIRDIYSGGFYPFPTEEEYWAWWSRHIYFNRYIDAPSDVYPNLLELVKDKDYFVLTTNVDHQFQRAGFDKKRMFYTQGDYGLFQSIDPDIPNTFDNEETVIKMMEDQGFVKNEAGIFDLPKDGKIRMEVSSTLIPVCPDDSRKMVPNLRSDDSFVEDAGWHAASERYADFCRRHENLHVLYLELGVGMNTPVIIKFQFWKAVERNKHAFYACINYGDAGCDKTIAKRSICMDEDIAKVLRDLKRRAQI